MPRPARKSQHNLENTKCLRKAPAKGVFFMADSPKYGGKTMSSTTIKQVLTSGTLCALLTHSAAVAQTDELPADNFFDSAETESEEQLDWDAMVKGSFGMPGDDAPEETSSGSEPVPLKSTVLEVLPPIEITNRLIEASSLPLLINFDRFDSGPTAWPKGKTWQTGLLPVSRTYDINGCRFHITTGPISVAHYEKSGTEYSILNDSVPAKNVLRPERGSSALYMSANADIYPTVVASTMAACEQALKGKIIPIGKFDMSATAIQIAQAPFSYQVTIADRSVVKPVQVYLYWPAGRKEPLLIDDQGLYPVVSSPIFEVQLVNTEKDHRGSGFLEIVPHLTYEKGH